MSLVFSEKLYDVTAEGGIDIYLNYFRESTFHHSIYTSRAGVILVHNESGELYVPE
jgi:hypothetical protein